MRRVIESIYISTLVALFIFVAIRGQYIMNGELYVKTLDDFSGIHGEGFTYQDGIIEVVDDNAYFVIDIGVQATEYYGMDIFISNLDASNASAVFSIGHSSAGDESDMVIEPQIEFSNGENIIEGEFGYDQYIRFIIDAPQGTTFSIDMIKVLIKTVKLTLIDILVFSLAFIGFFCFHQFMFLRISKKLLDYHYIIIGAIGEGLVLLYFIFSNRLIFATNDDTLKVAMAGGAYGKPSEYIGYNTVNILLGKLLKILFTYLPVINWITVLYLFIISFSCFGILVILIKSSRQNGYYTAVLMIEVFYFLCLDYFTFTVVAYSAVAFGTLALVSYLSIEKWEYLIYGVGGVAVACLIRPAVCYSALIVLGIYSLYFCLKNKKINGLVLCIAIFLVMQGILFGNRIITCSSDVEQKFYEWSKYRVEAFDAKQLSWDDNEEALLASGITADIYNIIYSARYVDRDVVSIDNLKTIIGLNVAELARYNLNPKSYFDNIFDFIHNPILLQKIYKLLFWCMLLVTLLFSENRFEILSVGISAIVVECIFVFLNRNIYRVNMPVYFMALFIMFLLVKIDDDTSSNTQKRRYIYVANFLLICSGTLIVNGFNTKWKNFDYGYSRRANAVLSYMEDNQDILFFPVSSELYALEVYRPVFKFAGMNGICYLCGNGESYSIPYYEVMSHYDIVDADRPILEAVNNEKMYFIGTSDVARVNEVYSPILNYVGDKQGVELELVKVDQITDGFSSYELVSVGQEH